MLDDDSFLRPEGIVVFAGFTSLDQGCGYTEKQVWAPFADNCPPANGVLRFETVKKSVPLPLHLVGMVES